MSSDEPNSELPPPTSSRGGPKTAAGKKQSSQNSFKHGLTSTRAWSGVGYMDLGDEASRLAGQLGITAATAVHQVTSLFFSRDRDLGIAATEILLFSRSPAGVDLATSQPTNLHNLQDELSLSTLRTLKRQTVRQGRFITKQFQQVLALKPTEESAPANSLSPADEFRRLAVCLNIAERDREDFNTLAKITWNAHPPANRLALLITLDLIMDEWRITRLQAYGMLLLHHLAVSVNGTRLGYDYALLQDAQGLNAMEILQDLEVALRKRTENRVKQLATANAGPWPALLITEPVNLTATATEGDTQTEPEPGINGVATPAAAAASQPDKNNEH